LNDYEYLAEAGIDAETGNAPEANATAATPTETTQPETAQTAEQKAVEMFELQGNKYPVTTEFQLTHGGKILKVPYSKMANTYRQWEHMQDKWTKEYKPKIDEFEKLRPEYDRYKGFYDKYGALQEWSEKNPDQWARLWEMYQNKDRHLLASQVQGTPDAQANPLGANLDPFIQKITELEQKLGKYDQHFQTLEQKEKEAQEAKDVEFVKTEIHTFQKEFPEINLDERDPDGVALWAKVVTWGLQNGYHEFKPAALMYLQDRVKDAWESRARSEALKGLKTDRQNGIVKRSATPLSGQGNTAAMKDTRKMSYGEIAELSKQMLSAQN
jgi:hypothetical protein